MTNATQNPDVTETQQKSKAAHIMTVLVDLSHPSFAGGGMQARVNLIEVLKGVAKGIMVGAEATIIGGTADGTDPVGVFVISEDTDGTGKVALRRVVESVAELAARDDYNVVHV